MATKQVKTLVLKRVPPGDQWTDAVGESAVFESLTDGLEYSFQKSEGKNTEFHLSAFKGEIFAVHTEEQPDAPPPPYHTSDPLICSPTPAVPAFA